jgi:SAM-dependent methyltransferase
VSGRSSRRKDELVTPLRPVPEVVWHDLECGLENADLPLWEKLAETETGAPGPILELGCGTGRVGLHLARRGHEVVGVDREPALVAAFNERAALDELPAQALVVDARQVQLRRGFRIAIAPMQLIQQLGDATERLAALRAITSHLDRGARAAFAIVEEKTIPEDSPSGGEIHALPDVRELHGWVFQTRPVRVRAGGRGIVIERLRESVSPQGERFIEPHTDHLDALTAERLEDEARLTRLYPVERHRVESPGIYAPSTVVVVERR